MTILPFVEQAGEPLAAMFFGLLTGLIFGVAAQRSRFCLRAATIEFARLRMGPSVAVWLLTFSTALVWVQGAQSLGLMESSQARMMAITGSWSGAIIGGLLFGVGMVLARGCSGRLLVLAASGNLRAVVSGLIFVVVAQMSLSGWLSQLRDWFASLWVTAGGRNLDLLAHFGMGRYGGLILGLVFALIALIVARHNRIGASRLVFASGVGFAVALGWVLTYQLSQISFEPTTVQSVTFSGASAKTLMFLLERGAAASFEIGLIPGVFIGAFAAAAATRELAFEGFDGEGTMRRAMTGAGLMGFGAMLAGGCAIGNGVTGGSIFAGTAWVALACMWVGAMVADFMLDQDLGRAVAA